MQTIESNQFVLRVRRGATRGGLREFERAGSEQQGRPAPDRIARAIGEALAQRAVAAELADPLRERAHVARLDDETVHAVVHDLARYPAGAGDDGRAARRECFVHAQSPLVEFAREHDEVRERVEVRHFVIRQRTEDRHVGVESVRGDARAQCRIERPLTHEHEADAALAQPRLRIGVDQHVDVLARHEAAHAQQETRRQAVAFAHAAGVVARALCEAREIVDVDDVEADARTRHRDAERERVAAVPFARDERAVEAAHDHPLEAFLGGAAHAVVGFRIGHVDELEAPREMAQRAQQRRILRVVAERDDHVGRERAQPRDEARAVAQAEPVAVRAVFDERDGVRWPVREERRAALLREAVDARAREDFEQRHVVPAAGRGVDEGFVARHVVVAQVADDEENAHGQ
ncbi:hypothetical protein PT2222_20396 [Paraburkholderia tropica]